MFVLGDGAAEHCKQAENLGEQVKLKMICLLCTEAKVKGTYKMTMKDDMRIIGG